ncbi:hypothetical protein PilKf_02503 [Pillotina sp. SPG140]
MPSNPTKTNYTFVAWNTKADGTGTTFTASTKVTANITVYAQWTENLTTVNNYTLSENSAFNPAGLSIESAKKGVVSGVTTIVLKGTITSGIPTGLATDFVVSEFTTDTTADIPTKYSAFVIKGLELGDGVTIKQTNNSFILYKGTDGYEDPTWNDGNGDIVVTNGTHVKEKIYTDGDPNKWDGGFDILIADGVTPKTAKLEITPAGTGKTPYTVIIDWSNVTFNSAS